MANVWTLLIEFAFLGLVAFGYYWYQRNKIIRNDKIEIYHTISEMLADLDVYLDKNSEDENISDMRDFSKALRDSNESQNYEKISALLQNPPKLPDTFSNSFPSINEQVKFHIKKK